MKRNLEQLSNNIYDLLVIGGGIYGACIAWDAALRGLSVALVEKEDFGQAASANSLKIIHGGLRYLQDGSLSLVRQMSRERRAWMRIAPHLVTPLPCLMPTTARLSHSRMVMKMALILNDLVSVDRNRGMSSNHYLPNGRVISAQSCLDRLPGLSDTAVTGAAIWNDAQILNSERLLLAIIESAVTEGAHVANYVEAVDFLQNGSRISGVRAVDKLTGESFTIQAHLVVNSAGAWVDTLLARLNVRSITLQFPLSTATNIVTRKLFSDYAIALPGRQGNVRFIVPWRQYSLIGTVHQPYRAASFHGDSTEAAVQTLLDDINFAYPAAGLTREDVIYVNHGFLPITAANDEANEVKLRRKSSIHDHEIEDGLPGLITIVGVKYTTARHTAEKTVDLICRKLKRTFVSSQTAKTPIHGGDISNYGHYLAQAQASKPIWLSDESLKHLIQNYGTTYPAILAYRSESPVWGRTVSSTTPVLLAEIIHAVRTEMAQTLGDVIQRRTPLGVVGLPDVASILRCADLMTAELNWTPQKRFQEIRATCAAYGQSPPEIVQQPDVVSMNGNDRRYEGTSIPLPITANSR
jgi:glycerol-3-phosphate dehydrogenase